LVKLRHGVFLLNLAYCRLANADGAFVIFLSQGDAIVAAFALGVYGFDTIKFRFIV